MKSFNVPIIYRSPLITAIKERRKQQDRMKKDFTPAMLDFGSVQVLLARHFGFCYGVENAIEISFRALDENPGKRIFLLSEMIHNPHVNQDLLDRGVRFILNTAGQPLIPWEELKQDDIVIIPAFGTTLEVKEKLQSLGIQPLRYNTTCPFVERVWNKAEAIGKKDYTVIVHGKPHHEETRATFSHTRFHAPTVVVKDMEEARRLAAYIKGEKNNDEFRQEFRGQYSAGFDVEKDFRQVGVVNQTTMLASETQAIADFIREVMAENYRVSGEAVSRHFADTRDTLCYATNDNQSAVMGMLEEEADLAVVVGGYNSSNTSHLVELCEERLPTYFVSSDEKILSPDLILHWDFQAGREVQTKGFLPAKEPVRIMLTSGASCPDALVEGVLRRMLSFYGLEEKIEEMIRHYSPR